VFCRPYLKFAELATRAILRLNWAVSLGILSFNNAPSCITVIAVVWPHLILELVLCDQACIARRSVIAAFAAVIAVLSQRLQGRHRWLTRTNSSVTTVVFCDRLQQTWSYCRPDSSAWLGATSSFKKSAYSVQFRLCGSRVVRIGSLPLRAEVCTRRPNLGLF